MVKRYTGRVYKIENDVDDQLYIGSTIQKLSSRMTGHRAKVYQGSTFGVHKHMRELGVGHFKIILIEMLEECTKEQLRARENHFIKQFDTVKNGLNGKYEVDSCVHGRKHSSKCPECLGHPVNLGTCSRCKKLYVGDDEELFNGKPLQTCIDCRYKSNCPHGHRMKTACKVCTSETKKAYQCQHGNRPQRCQQCNGDKYKCGVCNTVFGSKQALTRHNRSKRHREMKQFMELTEEEMRAIFG